MLFPDDCDDHNWLSVTDFQQTWLENFINPETNEEDKKALIYALLTIAKSKPIWEKIEVTEKTINLKNYRDELCLKIAQEFYAIQPTTSKHHIPSFFYMLAKHEP